MRRLFFLLAGLVVLWLPAAASADGGCSNEGLREAQGSTFLPDCRVYEMVSPPDKNGGDVMPIPLRTRGAADGNGVVFSSSSAFANARGTSVVVEYLARRSASGWSINGITPPQDPIGFIATQIGAQARLVGELSPDLSTGVMIANRPLTSGAPNVKNTPNLYLRTNLDESLGSYELLSDSVNPIAPSSYDTAPAKIYEVGASADFSHVIFESREDLTSNATGEDWKLYESEHGTVRLVGVLPDGTPLAESRASGREERREYATHMISQDGSRIFFIDPVNHNVYVREDHSTTTKLNVEERATPDPNGPSGASVWDATPDGSQVFIITGERLTEDDNNNGSDLYRYDFNAPAGHHLTLLSRPQEGYESNGVAEVLGVSQDGSYVYFYDNRRIFVWHNGAIHFVGNEEQYGSWIKEGAGALSVYNGFKGSGVRVTPNGVLVYTSSTPQTSYDTLEAGGEECATDPYVLPTHHDPNARSQHCDEVYVYDPAVGSPECASCDPSGKSPTGDADFIREPLDKGAVGYSEDQHLPHAVSDDGSKVFFDSPDALVPQDTNGQYDVYEYDVITREVHLISSGQSKADSVFLEASPDGRNVFFTTRQQLVGQDGDSNTDLYDARVEGGIAGQDERPTAGCVGDACQGFLNAAPGILVPPSMSLSGAGNLPGSVSPPVVKAKPHAKKKPKVKKRKAVRHNKQRKSKRARRSGMSASHRVGR